MATLKSIKNKYLQTSDGDTLGVDDNASNVALLAFKMQAADSIAKFNMVDGFADAYADATGIDGSASSGETHNSSSKFYSGLGVATGGTVTTVGSYTVHSFLADGNFVTGGSGTVDALIVAGGGAAGGHQGGGGGGGGGMRVITGIPFNAGTFAVEVGAGGISTSGCNNNMTAAEDSTLAYNGGTYTAAAGGQGGGCGNAATNGGSGGGGAGTTGGASGGSAVGGGNAGHNGGTGQGNSPNSSPHMGGGGGGAGASGQSHSSGGDGGSGANNDYRTGSNVAYAGGGGGGAGTGATSNSGNGGEGVVAMVKGAQVSVHRPEEQIPEVAVVVVIQEPVAQVVPALLF